MILNLTEVMIITALFLRGNFVCFGLIYLYCQDRAHESGEFGLLMNGFVYIFVFSSALPFDNHILEKLVRYLIEMYVFYYLLMEIHAEATENNTCVLFCGLIVF